MVWVPLLLFVGAADAGTPPAAHHASSPSAQRPSKPAATPGTSKRALPTASVPGAAEFRDVVSGASTTAAAPSPASPVAGVPEEPSNRVEVREPDVSFDAGVLTRTDNRAAFKDTSASPPPVTPTSAETTNQALLEQSRAQTEAMQALLAQQQAQEQARVAEQQARNERTVAMQDVRDSLGGTVQALATSGNWDPESLSRASASLRRTAASATTSGSPSEAARASEAANMVEAAQGGTRPAKPTAGAVVPHPRRAAPGGPATLGWPQRLLTPAQRGTD